MCGELRKRAAPIAEPLLPQQPSLPRSRTPGTAFAAEPHHREKPKNMGHDDFDDPFPW